MREIVNRIFFKGMEIASKTLTGKLATLKDNISLTAASLGMQLLPTIKPIPPPNAKEKSVDCILSLISHISM